MNSVFFKLNGTKYIIQYKNKNIEINKKIDDKIIKLSNEEKQYVQNKLNKKYNYIYNSELLNELISQNDKLDNKEYIINFLNWLEKIIPEECRDNFYRNVKTLKATLNLNFNIEDNTVVITDGYSTAGGYNTRKNELIISKTSLIELKTISNTTNNPEEFYWKEYAKTLLHELAHMASTNYNKDTGVSLCGFDKYPPSEEEDKNRGLTEGFTEIITMTGIPNTIEISSGYYIEACLINQLIQIIGSEIFIKSYFSNLGIKPIKEELYRLIPDENKTFSLFRNIELNFQIRSFEEEQSVLGNIQLSILDYLEKKLEVLLENNDINSIKNCLEIFEDFLITPDKLCILKMEPQNYLMLEESINKFKNIKQKYNDILVYESNHIKSA